MREEREYRYYTDGGYHVCTVQWDEDKEWYGVKLQGTRYDGCNGYKCLDPVEQDDVVRCINNAFSRARLINKGQD